ncbi:iron-sulfur cluster-binding domain-containing protein [Candidatus Magnetoovum chiemensis]|nr:iron-sulfur cluster-binding domain-containing protein [Candidatus Magnetoovum chiemensis]
MTKVLFKKSSYNYDELKDNIYSLLSDIDNDTIKQGDRVLIKPNLLAATSPDKAITTHPKIVRAVCEYVLEKGASVQVSDSPALDKFDRVVKETELKDTLKDLNIKLKPLENPTHIPLLNNFKQLKISKDAVDADVVINLPKLKSHTQMGLTLAVKNLFGCVVGFQKSQWHLKIGENREKFAELLVTIHNVIKPSINIIDGILALEGNGPGSSGTVKHIGLLIASTNAVSLDMAICEMLGINPYTLATNNAAKRLNGVNDYTIIGDFKKVTDFKLPVMTSIVFGPDFIKKFIRKNLTARPSGIRDKCKVCTECIKICPAGAIENQKTHVGFDYHKCIRCFCCLEICPHAAIKVHEPILGKAVRKFI